MTAEQVRSDAQLDSNQREMLQRALENGIFAKMRERVSCPYLFSSFLEFVAVVAVSDDIFMGSINYYYGAVFF